jgi:ribosomal protein L40E
MLGPEFGKRAVRFALTVVGLLILRAVLDVLPMLSKASAIGDSLVSPLVIANAVVDTMIFLALLRFGVSIGRSIRASFVRFPDLGNIVSLAFVVIVLLLAYKQYETLTACIVITPADFAKVGQSGTPLENLDQLLRGLGNLFGTIVNTPVKVATGDTLVAFQRVAVALFRQPPDLYGWIFLVLIAIPVVGIVVLVWRNMDTITSLVMQSGSALAGAPSVGAAVQCGSCGQPTAVGVKFCPNCGAASAVPTVSARSVCPSCGAENPGSAKFCKECGRSVQ